MYFDHTREKKQRTIQSTRRRDEETQLNNMDNSRRQFMEIETKIQRLIVNWLRAFTAFGFHRQKNHKATISQHEI